MQTKNGYADLTNAPKARYPAGAVQSQGDMDRAIKAEGKTTSSTLRPSTPSPSKKTPNKMVPSGKSPTQKGLMMKKTVKTIKTPKSGTGRYMV